MRGFLFKVVYLSHPVLVRPPRLRLQLHRLPVLMDSINSRSIKLKRPFKKILKFRPVLSGPAPSSSPRLRGGKSAGNPGVSFSSCVKLSGKILSGPHGKRRDMKNFLENLPEYFVRINCLRNEANESFLRKKPFLIDAAASFLIPSSRLASSPAWGCGRVF